jgi:hypothetical protein
VENLSYHDAITIHTRKDGMDIPPGRQLDRMISGYWISQAIYAAARFGIPDLLKDGPRSVDDLAAATGTHVESLYRLLRALASVGVFVEQESKRFALTKLAEFLRGDVPGSKRALALMMGSEQFRAWSEIEYSIRTGEKAFDKVYGEPIFDYLGKHPEQAAIFDAAMVGIHGRETDDVLDAYDFSSIKTLADIGGGNGSQLIRMLTRHTQMQGVLFDLPHVVARAAQPIASAGLADRCRIESGDFFKAVPAGADAYVMRHIIHDWNDEQCRTILKNIHSVMPAHGKLLVIESVIPPGNDPFGGKLLDLVMLLIPGGKERTAEEYRKLFASAGFILSRIVPTPGEISVIEGVKA